MTVITRRRLLAAAGICAVTGAGAVAGLLVDRPSARSQPRPAASATPTPTTPPAFLAGLLREQQLIAAIDAAVLADPSLGALTANIRADHVAHATTLSASTSAPNSPEAGGPSPSASGSGGSGGAPTVVTLRAAEQGAQQAAAASSALLDGAAAVLMASIAACEAGHVELLS